MSSFSLSGLQMLRGAVSVVAIICATILAARKREGWGWLLAIAYFACP